MQKVNNVIKDSFVANTPNAIKLFRLASIRGRISLEAKGLRFSSGKNTRSQVAEELGLPPRAKPAVFIAELNRRILELHKMIEKEPD